MKKILCIIDTLQIGGGAQTQLVGLASMLNSKGYIVKFLSYFKVDPQNSLEPYLKSMNIDVLCLSKANNKFSKLVGVYKIIKSFQPNDVIAYLDGAASISCIIKMFYNKFRLIVSERNVTQKLTKKERLKFFLYKNADYIVPNAHSQAKFIKEHFHKFSTKVTTISNFVDTDKFYQREYTNHNNESLELLVVARIGDQKNVLGFLESLSLLKKEGIKLHVDWFGKHYPEYYNLCINKVKSLGLEDYITFFNPTKDIASIYQNSKYDVFCLPSFFEGCPNTIGEAMSCGYPIICSNVCDNARYVHSGINGFLFNPYDKIDIADKVKAIISLSFDEKFKMSNQSRSIAETMLSKENFLNKYIDLLNS